MSIQFSRMWAMPSADTFDIPPIGMLVRRYLDECEKLGGESVDPFARNKRWATYTNDLNPDTAAEYHCDALDFLRMLKARGVKAKLLIFDPPYSYQQMMQVYSGVGRKISGRESQRFYGDIRSALDAIAANGAVSISCGWNSIGMGKTRGWKIIEGLMVCHGRAHNDTIVTVERKVSHQAELMI